MITTYFKNCITGNVFHCPDPTPLPTSYYLALSTSTPAVDGTGVREPSVGAGYCRIPLPDLGSPVNGVLTNESEIKFRISTGGWGSISHFLVYDSEEVGSGNLLLFERLDPAVRVDDRSALVIPEGKLKLETTGIS